MKINKFDNTIIFDSNELIELYEKYYYNKNYSQFDDPNITYQEFVLLEIISCYYQFPTDMELHLPNKFTIRRFFRQDNEYSFIDTWNKHYVAHFFQPIIINQNWNEVLKDRAHSSASNYFFYFDDNYPANFITIDSHDISPYKELWNKQNIEEQKVIDKNILIMTLNNLLREVKQIKYNNSWSIWKK